MSDDKRPHLSVVGPDGELTPAEKPKTRIYSSDAQITVLDLEPDDQPGGDSIVRVGFVHPSGDMSFSGTLDIPLDQLDDVKLLSAAKVTIEFLGVPAIDDDEIIFDFLPPPPPKKGIFRRIWDHFVGCILRPCY